MTDEFGQRIIGIFAEGDSIVATDKHPALFAKKTSDGTYRYLEMGDSGDLTVTFTNSSIAVTGSVTATTNYEYTVGTTAAGTDVGAMTLAVRTDSLSTLSEADGEYTQLRVDSEGALWVKGSLSITQPNSVNKYGSATLVKDTINTVVTETPASATEKFTAILVSGAGMCEWTVEFGLTATPAVIMSFWTTPSHPTEYIDLPDYLEVTTLQTLRVRAINREKAASPGSDFTGHATLIRAA